jgi:outer membrane protein OmpA-like peptidoglycan-associated protein
MTMKYLPLFVTLFMLFPISLLRAQKIKEAERLYNDLGYATSIPLLKETIDKKGMKPAELEKIANSYRLIHDTENAEIWYEHLVKVSDVPIHYLHYAQALQSNKKYEEAKTYYLIYDQLIGGTDQRGRLLATAIDNMNEIKQTNIQLKNERRINSEKLDFSPAFYRNGIVFVSTRAPEGKSSKKDIWIDDNFMTLFYTEKNPNNELKSPKEFSESISTDYHEGPLSSNRKGDRIFFTRSNYKKGNRRRNKDNIVRLNIYSAEKEGKSWGVAEKLSFCTDEFDEMHPSFSEDGSKLFFSSNREGGFGGMDLYMARLLDGEWTQPVNLGPNINTSGNEGFSFIHEDGTLYFSSDGWGGLGGLDIFSSTLVDEQYWSEPVNIGIPFNSSKDDFGFILNVLETEGYLSSARDGGEGHDDIYSFNTDPRFLKKPKVARLLTNLCVYDEQTKERITNVQVSILEGTRDKNGFQLDKTYTLQALPGEEGRSSYRVLLNKNRTDTTGGYIDLTRFTNEKGEISYDLRPDKEYVFIAKKSGYELGHKIYSTEGIYLPTEFSLCIPLTRMEGISLKGIVTNFQRGNRLTDAQLTLLNECTGEKRSGKSNMLGEFSFPNLSCDCTYSLTTTKIGFETDITQFDLNEDNCPEDRVLNHIVRLRSRNDGEDVASNTSTKLGIGTVIELEMIYYDFDDASIRPGAARTLDQLVEVLRQYPSMHIELAAHTDSRGSWKYNDNLSKRRANYARQYLMNRGISANRMHAIGWGKSKLRNDCREDIHCSEEAHQYNRRTEITITQLNRPDINILYLNNPPEVVDRRRGSR